MKLKIFVVLLVVFSLNLSAFAQTQAVNVKKTDSKREALLAWLKKEFDLGGPLLRATPNNLDNRWLDRR